MIGHILWLIVHRLIWHVCRLVVCALGLHVGRLAVTHVWGLTVVPRVDRVAVSITRGVDASTFAHRFVMACHVLHFVRLTGIGRLVLLRSPHALMMAKCVNTQDNCSDKK